MPEVEDLTMHLAKLFKIETADHALIIFESLKDYFFLEEFRICKTGGRTILSENGC